MEEQMDALGMLDLLTVPGFCVKDARIIKVNAAAAGLMYAEGMEILPLLHTGSEEYSRFSGGCLCLCLQSEGQLRSASVTRQGDVDVFVLEEDAAQPELQALALAARELRSPLNNAMLIADRLLDQADPDILEQVSRLNRGLYQMLRIIGNMSDAGYPTSSPPQSLHDMATVMGEILQKAQLLAEASGMTLNYEGLQEPVYSLCNPETLERAVLNILSNAIKFSPRGSTIDASFTRSRNMLRLSIQDSGTGVGSTMLSSIFYRFLRQPAIEDSRHGIGLGMVLVRTAAAQHDGTVLIDQPESNGTRVTLTLAIRQEPITLHSQVMHPVACGYDTGLIELSEVLPAEMYDGTK